MFVLVIIVPLLIWGLFMPSSAAASYVGLVVLFEGALLADLKLNRPQLMDSTQVPTPKQIMFRRYHQFLRTPYAAVAMSRWCSGIAVFSIPWAALLLWKGHWILALVIGGNYFIACTFASILNPLSALEHIAKRNPVAFLHLAVLRSLYEERISLRQN